MVINIQRNAKLEGRLTFWHIFNYFSRSIRTEVCVTPPDAGFQQKRARRSWVPSRYFMRRIIQILLFFFFKPEVSKHNTNMTQNDPPWFCGERKPSSWEGLGWCSWPPWCLCSFQQSSRICHPTPAHGRHSFGPLWMDKAGWSSSPTSVVLQTCPIEQVSPKTGLCA